MKNKTWYGTTAWIAHETFESETPINRWIAFKILLRGTIKTRWQVPINKKRKGLYIKGKKIKNNIYIKEL